jgi:VCBS repeat-containing protein
MTKSLFKAFSVITILALMLMALPMQSVDALGGGSGSISLATLGNAYTQNFDTLSNVTGSTTNVLTINGWYLDESGTSSRNNGQYAVDTGGSTTGDIYSYGAASNTERAYGTLRSGTLIPIIGASFTNSTGSIITSLAISYTGEQWRAGVLNRGLADRLDFQVSTSATSLTSGTWTDYDSLDFNSPNINASTSTLDGNASGNRATISFAINGLNIADGSSFWIRWTDFDISSSDDGLAVDDFSLTPDFVPTPTNPSGVGAASPSTLFAGDSTLLAVAVTPGTNPASTGLAVSCDLSSIGGSASQAFYDDGSNGDATAGDNTFSYSATVANGTTGGAKSLPCTITDAEARTGNATISLTVTSILRIGTVNGAVSDTENATTHRSPFAPASGNGAGSTTVVVQGVIYERTFQPIANSSNFYKGFFIQNTSATADSDPLTSDGLFVFMNTNATITGPSGPYTPQVGDEVVISGRISEFFNMTELQSPDLAVLKIVRTGVDIDTEVAPADANPPVNLADANRYWERLQGMRVQAPANSIVLGGRNVFSPADAEIWLARPDSTIALRTDPYERRSFRDAHPLDDNYDPNNWDGNGYRMLIGSWGIKFAAGDAQALMDPARTFDTLSASVSGGLNYTFNKYRIEISAQPTFTEGVDPKANHAPLDPDRATEYSIADFNVENLYDYRDNPFSGCDFTGNSGCPVTAPFISPVNPPYDYVPASDAAYQARLTDIATQIIDVLHAPDILMMQEVENQDICIVSGGTLVCGTTDNADGKPDDLQDLALKIASLGGPTYDAAFDRNSSDLRGILPSFMYRTDRVQLLSPVGDPILGSNPAIDSYTAVPYDSDISNPKTLNAVLPAGISATGCETTWIFPRAPDIGLFRIYSSAIGDQTYRDVYVIDNHFKSNPDTCKPNRTEQARYNAAIVAYLQSVKPNANIVLGGDLNVYARPDDTTPPSDQLASLYDSSLGLKNLYEVELEHAPEAAYTYVFLGMAQTIDQIFVNQSALAHLSDVRTAHINSDFPADYPDDVARGTSDHDPTAARFFFNLAPVATNDSYSVNEDTGLTVSAPGVLANDSDVEGDSLVAVLVSGPSHGVLNLNADGSFSYTPSSNFNGSDSFTYQAKDPYNALSNVATVSITVNAVNDAPVCTSPQSASTNEDTALNASVVCTDVDNDTLTYSSVSNPSHGTLTLNSAGTFTYSPNANYNGSDSFTFKANDGNADSNVATFNITITAVNDAPVATSDSATVAKNGSVAIFVLTNDYDVDGDTLTVTSFTQPAHGTVAYSTKNKNFRYTPTKGFSGTDSFTYTISDGHGGTATATVTITVQ